MRDNGIGIDGELLPRVFDLFAQGERSLDRSQGGLGVGLTLVQRLVELHGGTRRRRRSDGAGQGAEFSIVLPCLSEVGASEGAGSRRRRRPRSPAAPPHPRRRRQRRRRREHGDAARAWTATRCKTRRRRHQALACAEVFAPDVVLLDIGLPRHGRLRGRAPPARAAARRAACLIVALTGYGQPDDRERAREAGFDHHLIKPADPVALLALIAGWMRSRAPGRGQGERERRSPHGG